MLPPLDLAGHARLLTLVTTLVGEGMAGGPALVAGIHDVSGGGLGVALAEMSVRSGIGLQVAGISDHHELFTEAPSRVLVCTTEVTELSSRAADAGVGFRVLGTAGGERITVEGLVDVSVDDATTAWRDRLPTLLDEFEPAVAN
jgi:phosphoribosylformylglycinamidine synthase